MKKDTPSKTQNFVGYEEARQGKAITPKHITEKAVKAATNRINPDENNQERG